MDKKLKTLFEFQKFAQNPKLEEVIKTADPSFEYELNDEFLFGVTGGKQAREDSDKEREKIV